MAYRTQSNLQSHSLDAYPRIPYTISTMSDPNSPPQIPLSKPLPTSVPPGYAGNTPLMLQYFATREEHPGAILLMRVGDFFEAYGDDAETIVRELNITLTGREDGGQRIPMAGVPHHAMERYMARLIARDCGLPLWIR